MPAEMSFLDLPLGLSGEQAIRSRAAGRDERRRIVGECAFALNRWYLDRSQTGRSWNPDRSFDWRNLRQDHLEPLTRP